MRALAVVALSLLATGCAESASSVDPAGAALSVRADGCGPRLGIGSATLVGDDVAITAAHVVAGSSTVAVRDIDGTDHVASVVVFDPDLDLALLHVPRGLGSAVPISDRRVEPGDDARIDVLRADGAEATLDVDILRRANVMTTDIYLDGEVTRPGFEIRADIEPGDSGSVVVIDDAIAGVVWSRSLERNGRAWAVNVSDSLRAAIDGDGRAPVDTGPCP